MRSLILLAVFFLFLNPAYCAFERHCVWFRDSKDEYFNHGTGGCTETRIDITSRHNTSVAVYADIDAEEIPYREIHFGETYSRDVPTPGAYCLAVKQDGEFVKDVEVRVLYSGVEGSPVPLEAFKTVEFLFGEALVCAFTILFAIFPFSCYEKLPGWEESPHFPHLLLFLLTWEAATAVKLLTSSVNFPPSWDSVIRLDRLGSLLYLTPPLMACFAYGMKAAFPRTTKSPFHYGLLMTPAVFYICCTLVMAFEPLILTTNPCMYAFLITPSLTYLSLFWLYPLVCVIYSLFYSTYQNPKGHPFIIESIRLTLWAALEAPAFVIALSCLGQYLGGVFQPSGWFYTFKGDWIRYLFREKVHLGFQVEIDDSDKIGPEYFPDYVLFFTAWICIFIWGQVYDYQEKEKSEELSNFNLLRLERLQQSLYPTLATHDNRTQSFSKAALIASLIKDSSKYVPEACAGWLYELPMYKMFLESLNEERWPTTQNPGVLFALSSRVPLLSTDTTYEGRNPITYGYARLLVRVAHVMVSTSVELESSEKVGMEVLRLRYKDDSKEIFAVPDFCADLCLVVVVKYNKYGEKINQKKKRGVIDEKC